MKREICDIVDVNAFTNFKSINIDGRIQYIAIVIAIVFPGAVFAILLWKIIYRLLDKAVSGSNSRGDSYFHWDGTPLHVTPKDPASGTAWRAPAVPRS
jgi:hypothetical protein